MGLEELERWIGEAFGQWTRVMDQSRVDGSATNRVQGLGTGKGTDFLQWIQVGSMDCLEDLERWIGEAFGQWTRATDRSRVDGSAANRVQVVGTSKGTSFLRWIEVGSMDRLRVW